MPAQFLLNLFIAFLWMLLSDEDELRFSTFLAGFFVGIGIVFSCIASFGQRFYLRRVFSTVKLIIIFISELTAIKLSSCLKKILSPKLKIRPGIFKYETQLKSDWK